MSDGDAVLRARLEAEVRRDPAAAILRVLDALGRRQDSDAETRAALAAQDVELALLRRRVELLEERRTRIAHRDANGFLTAVEEL